MQLCRRQVSFRPIVYSIVIIFVVYIVKNNWSDLLANGEITELQKSVDKKNVEIKELTKRFEKLSEDIAKVTLPENLYLIQKKIRIINDENAFGICKENMQRSALPHGESTTSLLDWNFTNTTNCPLFSINMYPMQRRRTVSLNCNGDIPRLVEYTTNSSTDIHTVNFGNKCLGKFIDTCCDGNGKAPNVIHHVWYADNELKYIHFLSFISALRFIKPCVFLLHGAYVPKGKYWDYFISIAPNVLHVYRERPTSIFGHQLKFPEHGSDVMRIEALKEYGGIYMDTDQIVLRSLETLRQYEHVQGFEASDALACSMIIAKKNGSFLDHWYDSYRTNYKPSWGFNSVINTAVLAKKYPGLIHTVGFKFINHTVPELGQLFSENYNWSEDYAMHLYARFYKNPIDENIIRQLNTTLGSVSRHVLFGDKELCIN